MAGSGSVKRGMADGISKRLAGTSLSSASQTSQSDLITPNAMQKAACKRIEALRQAGEKRALVSFSNGDRENVFGRV